VTRHRALFMPDDLDDLQKAATRRGYWAASGEQTIADRQQPPPPPVAPRPTGHVRALGTWTIPDKELGGTRPLNAGTIVSVDDPLYRAYPHLFGRIVEERT
jgi:hypothetical protein